MKKITIISLTSFVFLIISSLVAYVLGVLNVNNLPATFFIGIFILIINGILSIFLKHNVVHDIILLTISSISLVLLIRSWYIFRGFDNSPLILLLVCISCVAYILIYYLLMKIPFLDRHRVLFTILFIIISTIGYIIVMANTTTTYVSTFGYYMIIQISFIIALCMEAENTHVVLRNMVKCSFSIFIVAVIIGIMILAGDGADFDFSLDGLSFDGGGGSSKKDKKKL